MVTYKSSKSREFRMKTLRFILLAVLCIPMLLPLLWMISTALKSNTAVFNIPPQWIPSSFQWNNFSIGLMKIDFWKRFAISTVLSIIVTIGQICSCMCVGYALARLKFPGRKIWFYLIIGSMMIPGMVSMIPVFRFCRAPLTRK